MHLMLFWGVPVRKKSEILVKDRIQYFQVYPGHLYCMCEFEMTGDDNNRSAADTVS